MAVIAAHCTVLIYLILYCSDQGKRKVKKSSLLSKLRKVFSLDREGDLMAVLGAAERLKPGILDYICGSSELV